MAAVAWTPLEWLAVFEYELLLFAGVFFLVGALDEFAVDGAWLWLKLTGKATTRTIDREATQELHLNGDAAVLIPAWLEERVIGDTIIHTLSAWPQRDLRIYVGCYRNDPATAAAIVRGAGGDPRVRLVVHDRLGPTTKADCLNRLYLAVEADEARTNRRYRQIVLQDAEDMVDPAALALMDRALDRDDFIQLPVLPERQMASRWIGSHYIEEFAEAHGKAMVVRSALGAALPAAGVGCAISREMLARLAHTVGEPVPFSPDSLTEDYELGMRIKELKGKASFLRVRGEDGQLVATRACFPSRLDQAVRQKSRWVHGIALQGWDRIGWSGGAAESWMRVRDRRGPITALVLFCAYLLIVIGGVLGIADLAGFGRQWRLDPLIVFLLAANFLSFGWRAVMRFAFTAKDYGAMEGIRAVMRIPIANIVAIMAGRRAFVAYLRSLRGAPVAWDKTYHHAHAVALRREEAPA